MADYEIVRDAIYIVSDQLGEPIKLKLANSNWIDGIFAVVSQTMQNTDEGDSKRLQINQRSFRFNLDDEELVIAKGDRILYNGDEWVIFSVLSGIYSQVRVLGERIKTLEVGKKGRNR